MKRLAWFAVARSPYNDFLFESVAKVVDLTIVYALKELQTHPWQLHGAPARTIYADDSLAECVSLAHSADGIVFSGWREPRYMALLGLLPRRTPKAFWTDTPRQATGLSPFEFARRMMAFYVFHSFDQVWSTGTVGCKSLRDLGCPPDKIRSLPFFYDLTRYETLSDATRQAAAQFREKHAAPGSCVFMVAGQLATKKRFDDAITALARLERIDARLWLCGVGPDEARLRAIAHELRVDDRVTFHGWLQPSELELAFIASDVFVHPAGFDPFPTVVLDAMTWSKAIVGTSGAGSVVDRVVPGENGFIYEPGDVNALARHMSALAQDRALLERMQRAARATACEYPVSLAVDRLIELMGSL